MARDVVLETLRHAWETLQPLNASMAVMGGIALAAWEHVRATHDVDLLIGLERAHGARIVQHMEAAGFKTKRYPPVMQLGRLDLVQFLYNPPDTLLDIQVDLLLGESEYQRAALSRRVATRLPGLDVELFVLSCEDLIVYKLLAGRILDVADCAALLVANRGALDWSYLARWSQSLGLTRELSDVWKRAFPGDRPPPQTP
jgi:hypothetical protein